MTNRSALDSLQPEWDALWESIARRTPFQHTAWLLPWCDAFSDGELRVVTFRQRGRLVAILPLYASNGREGTELRLLGAGVSDYLDMLVARAAEDDVMAALPEVFEQVLGDWSFCGLDHLRRGSPLLECSVRRGAGSTTKVEEPSAVMDLPAPGGDLLAQVGSKFANNIRYSRRRAEGIGAITVERASGRKIEGALTMLFTLHGVRWNRRGEPGVLCDARVRTFHRAAATALDRAGLLRLFVLRVGPRVAAVQYGLHAADRAYVYIGGFDPALSAISPGTLSLLPLIEGAMAEGDTAFDFLGGREAYKYRWGATDEPRYSRHLHHH